MKYARLTKEQLDELRQEFINFLAIQKITAEEWESIKKEKPNVAEEELDLFSDLVWEGVLTQVNYLEHFSTNQLFLFKVSALTMSLIGIKIDRDDIDITTATGYNWLQQNLMDDRVNLYSSEKVIKEEERNSDIFALIQQGANITKGELYEYMEEKLP
ncbi:DUF6495 family protein [Gangjinia marincola]|uniref:DUF6495 family protein n=1 Tax=Gangjinia marincola TaxID=578463 RepID=UPI0031CF8871